MRKLCLFLPTFMFNYRFLKIDKCKNSVRIHLHNVYYNDKIVPYLKRIFYCLYSQESYNASLINFIFHFGKVIYESKDFELTNYQKIALMKVHAWIMEYLMIVSLQNFPFKTGNEKMLIRTTNLMETNNRYPLIIDNTSNLILILIPFFQTYTFSRDPIFTF